MPSRLERLISIDSYIRAGNFPSVEKLCLLFEVQPRTIYQDLRELRQMFGIDIKFDRTRNGYYNADPTKRLPALSITPDEKLLIVIAAEMLAAGLGISFSGALSRTLAMICQSDEGPEDLSWVKNVIDFPEQADCEVSCSNFVRLLRAASEGHQTHLQLADSRAMKILPKKIRYTEDHWHVVGLDTTCGATVKLPVCEITDVLIS